jgi:hypothetical protein
MQLMACKQQQLCVKCPLWVLMLLHNLQAPVQHIQIDIWLLQRT